MVRRFQRIFGTHEYGSGRNMRGIVLFYRKGEVRRKLALGGKCFAIAHDRSKMNGRGRGICFFKNTECSSPRDCVDKVLGRVSLQWSSDNESDPKLAKRSYISREDLLTPGE